VAGSAQWTIGTVPTLIMSAPADIARGPAGWFFVTNGSGGAVYLGGGTATSASNGAAVAASSTLTGYLFPSDNIYAVTASGTSVMGVLITGA
jgi:hypothetical protein